MIMKSRIDNYLNSYKYCIKAKVVRKDGNIRQRTKLIFLKLKKKENVAISLLFISFDGKV